MSTSATTTPLRSFSFAVLCGFLNLILAPTASVSAFQGIQLGHQHPLYVRYREEQLERHIENHNTAVLTQDSFHSTTTHFEQEEETTTSTTRIPLMDENGMLLVDATIATPISFDEETGMVQTAVRAIVKHPVTTFVDSSVVGLSSTVVIAFGALHEVVDCLELEWTHHASSTTEGLAILSVGHFLHYGRETVRQLVELHEDKETEQEIASATEI